MKSNNLTYPYSLPSENLRGVFGKSAIIIAWYVSISILSAPVDSHASGYQNTNEEALLEQIQPLGGQVPDKSSASYEDAFIKLRHPNAQTLQLLMDEVTNIGVLEKRHSYSSQEAADRIYRIRQAFDVVGTNAAPLFPDLKAEFLSGKSVSASALGLLAIGDDGWPVLLGGLTNTNPRVRLAAVNAMRCAKETNASLAFPYLCDFATNSLESSLLRREAAESIEGIGVDPQLKIPVLIYIGKSDSDFSIRCMAIQAIGQTGVYDNDVRKFLEQASKDKNHYVRLAVETALKELNRK